MEGELQKIREGVLALMDKNLIQLASTDESKVLYYKMKSDYYRYLAECATDDAKGKGHRGYLCCLCGGHQNCRERPGRESSCPFGHGIVSVVAQRQIPIDQTVQKTAETPQLQCIDKVVDDPVVQIP